MNRGRIRKQFRITTLSLALGACFASGVQAQSNTTGTVFGQAAEGDRITVTHVGTGLERSVSVGASGDFRVGALPPGQYRITRTSAAGETSTREVFVNTGSGSNVSFAAAGGAATLDAITVLGSAAVNPIDVSSVESVTIFTEAQIDRLPVGRDITSVALLAPGTVKGDSRFKNVASFGGSSAAENVYYVNGFNVTNIVSGLAFNQVPFEAIAEQQLKTGGYGAEFGRSLGGVVNITTKRGGNEWTAGGNVFWSPDGLSEGRAVADDTDRDGKYRIVGTNTKTDSTVYNVYGGGPLIKDRLFFFGLFQGQKDHKVEDYEGGHDASDIDTPQGLVKLDWNINDDHRLELTAFRDRSVEKGTSYQQSDGIGGGVAGGTFRNITGGDNVIGKWTGYLTDNFTLSAMYGRGEYSRSQTNSNSENCPYLSDTRTQGTAPVPVTGCWIDWSIGAPNAGDVRKAWRVDGEWVLGDHTLRFGLDNERYETVDSSRYSGGFFYSYSNPAPGSQLDNGATVPDGVTELVRVRYLENGGTFLTRNNAWFIEDTWRVSDTLTAYMGLRNEGFENLNAQGGSFIDIKNTWAPRLGLSWDVNGDSTMKVFGNVGRYYIPVYANTNVRLAGAETAWREWYTFTGIDPITGTPVLGEQIGQRRYTSTGEVVDPRSVVDSNLKPMYQDEFIAGWQWQFAPKWTTGVRAVYRKLGAGMDDLCAGDGAREWALANDYSAAQANAIATALSHCFLTNPGNDLSANVDLDGTGALTKVVIPASALGLPAAKRRYTALELMLERAWDNKWFMQASYTWSRSRGNTEGYVKSDIGQDDAGITQDFDFPGLMDGAYGYLPNDRRHSLKVFGAYALTDELQLGASLVAQSGRPINCFGVYPADGPDGEAGNYGAGSFYCGEGVGPKVIDPETGETIPYSIDDSLHPRGSSGRVPWTTTLDLRLDYTPKWANGVRMGLIVKNVLNSKDYYRVQDVWDNESGGKLYNYKHPRSFVDPRTVTFTVGYDF